MGESNTKRCDVCLCRLTVAVSAARHRSGCQSTGAVARVLTQPASELLAARHDCYACRYHIVLHQCGDVSDWRAWLAGVFETLAHIQVMAAL